ncbi:NTE family protein [Dysgonomonas sp. PH5-45]|uniref:patatin-like phospholipase family protein n=1 Tax=unclassified Dysgonomonas TaxID=2630389 RepID=UPI002475AED7|nr:MULTISPECIES: patatin-like phospholipase family protein [unclassified Dysgonomonas]MDH6353770.1 NTE family protein [Dysgonomonas sp. PH5-45]MDH6386673.1 NTE family protein [Dysgonomonas sp. PH5-37]
MDKKEEIRKHKLGLALSGGGAKGFAHLGVMKALEERYIHPNIISGTSAGALAGVLYADGYSPMEIAELFKNKGFKEFAKFTIPQAGIFKSDGIYDFLKKHLRAKTFEGLNIPLRVVATDIERGTSVVFSEGPVIDAVVASCSFPIIFTPKEIKGRHYVDGGLFRNFPVSVIRQECEKVIGVNVTPLTHEKYRNSMIHIAERTYHYMSIGNTMGDRKLCDILIESTDVSKFAMFSLDHIDEIIKIGYDIAIEALGQKIEGTKENASIAKSTKK